MGINKNAETRAHRKCCGQQRVIQVRWDPFANLFGRKLSWGRFSGGGAFLDLWGLRFEWMPFLLWNKDQKARWRDANRRSSEQADR